MSWTIEHGPPAPAAPRPWRFRPAFLDALRGYTAAQFGSDAAAGLVVGAVALPLAIAFSIASGADPHAGLVTVVIAGVVVAVLGGTRVGVSGPTSSFVPVLYAVVVAGGAHGLSDLLVAVMLAGVLLVVAGLTRLGTILKLIPYKVTTGFTAGIAVTILLGQLPDVLGLHLLDLPSDTPHRTARILTELPHTQLPAVLVAAATVAVIVACKKWAPRVPGPAVALVAIGLAVHWLQVPVATVGDRFPASSNGIHFTGLPSVAGEGWLNAVERLLPTALIIAFLGAVETLSTAVVADGMMGTRHDSNQELVAQGVANVASPLFGGIASVGALARTAANISNGGRTPVAALVQVALIALVLYVAFPLAAGIPLAVLAGILVVAAWNMSQRRQFVRLMRMPRADAGVVVATFTLTVLFGLAPAILVGLLLASGLFMHRMSEMAHVELVDPKKDEHPFGHNVREADIPPGVRIYSIDGPFFFGAADRFSETMARVSEAPKVVILRMRAVPYMDVTGLHALEGAVEGLQRRGSRVMLSGIQAQPLDLMERSGAVAIVGDGNMFRSTLDALKVARLHVGATRPV